MTNGQTRMTKEGPNLNDKQVNLDIRRGLVIAMGAKKKGGRAPSSSTVIVAPQCSRARLLCVAAVR
jgi:hypothetical protein